MRNPQGVGSKSKFAHVAHASSLGRWDRRVVRVDSEERMWRRPEGVRDNVRREAGLVMS